MRTFDFDIEQYRLTNGPMGSDSTYGANGVFIIPYKNFKINTIVSDGLGWEHVSVTLCGLNRPPNWEEMSFVKNFFWTEDECVVQYHPPKSEYVNYHPNCLHLWRPTFIDIPLPPSALVGPKPTNA